MIFLCKAHKHALSQFAKIHSRCCDTDEADAFVKTLGALKARYFDPNIPLQNFVGYNDIRNDLAEQMETVAMTHLKQHLWHFIYRWAKRRVIQQKFIQESTQRLCI